MKRALRLCVFTVGFLTSAFSAFAGLEVTKEIVGNLAQVPSGQSFTYRLSYRAASTTTNFYDVVLTDVLPPELSYISSQGTAHTTNLAYNSGTRTLRVGFVNPLLAGSTGQIDLNVMFKKGSTPNGAIATNEAVLIATGVPAVTSTPVTIRATATNTVVAAKSLINPSVPLDQSVTYTVSATTPTDVGSLNMSGITMVDTLPSGAVFVQASGGGVYDAASNTVTWSLPDVVPGSANTQSRTLTVRYPATGFILANKVTNVVQVTGTPLGALPLTRTVALTNTIVAPTASSTFTKDVDGSYVYQGKPIAKTYNFNSVKNTGNTPLANVVVSDAIPDQIAVTDFYTGAYSGSPSGLGTGITVEYRTNQRGWTTASGSPFSGASSTRITVSSLNLAAGEYVTDLRWSFGDLPATYQITSLKFNANILTVDRAGNDVVTGQVIQNTGTMTYTDFNGPQTKTDPGNITVLSPRPVLQLEKGLVSGSSIAHGAVGSFYVRLRNTVNGAEPLINPVLADLLPSYLVIKPGTISIYRKPAGAPDPAFEQVDNFNGTGRTLLRWNWTGAAAYSLPTNDYIEIRFQALQPTGTLYGTKTNEVTLAKWDNVNLDLSSTSTRADSADLDGDGNKAETIYYKASTWTVPSDASMDSQKWVQGTLNDIWTRYPEASSVPGGRADYRLVVRNSGNVPQKDVVVDDILPFIGDGGVIDLSARASEWRPNLAGPVQAPTNVIVYYSTQDNPTRTDFVPAGPVGSTPANWSTNPPGNITRVRALRFVFQNYTLQPQQSMELVWPMRVPVGAPTGNEIAWNSFGFYATRTDSGTLLLAAEPLKVGIQTVMDTNAVYGDRVWFDANKDGVQQDGERGINGIRVDLWQDSGPQSVPDGVIDTNTDRYIGWTITGDDQDGNAGYYLFPNLTHGDYYARFAIPNPYVVTVRQAGSDPAADSDMDAVTGFTPITSIADQERDLTWDAGVWLPPYGLTLTKTAGSAADGAICWTNLGDTVAYRYTIVNTGELALIELALTDDVLGAITNIPGPLAAGASLVVTASMANVQADVTNTAVVLARPADSAGHEISGAPQATDQDDAVVKLYAAIGDYTWEDRDADGIKDPGEPGLAGVSVTLYDAAGEPVATTTTAANGFYAFRDLYPADYSVGFQLPAGGYRFSPADQGEFEIRDSDADPATGRAALTSLASGENDTSWDAGFYRLAAIGDTVWLDANLNGIQDAGEAPVGNVTVQLLDGGGATLAVTNTDSAGLYRFADLMPGPYALLFTAPAGSVFTGQDKGSNDGRDSDVAPMTGLTAVTTLISGEDDPSWDAGLITPAAGISVVKTAGTAPDGTIYHVAFGQDVVYTYVVSNSGNSFLAPVVVTDDKLGAVGTIPGPLAPGATATLAATSYHVTSNIVNVVTATGTPADAYGRALPVASVSDQDAAEVEVEVSLGDRVWLDADRDGIQDPAEAGFAGVTVILRDGAGTELSRMNTDASGLYLFEHLEPGSFSVEFVAPSGYFFSPSDAGGNDGLDSDANPATGRTPTVSLAGGQVDLSLDAGLFLARPAIDLVKTAGTAPDGEAFIVYGSGTVVYAYAVTNKGETWLSNLVVTDDKLGAIGTIAGPLAPGATQTLTATVTNLHESVTNLATVTANPTDEDGVDLPNVPDVTADDDAVVTILPRASLGDRLWIDAYRNGVQDPGEPGLMGVTVTLLDAAGATVASTVTASDGSYRFAELIPGDYRVRFALPSSAWHFTLADQGGDDASDSDADPVTGLTRLITLASGQDDLTWDAGVYGGLPPGYCESMILGQDFNAIVFGHFTATGGDTEGRLAVGGTARFNAGYSVGTATVGEAIPLSTGGDDMLIVGGDLYDGSWGVNGNIVYGGTRYGPAKYTGVNSIRHVQPVTLNAGGNVPDDGSGASFAQILGQLRLASAMIGAMDDRGVVVKDLDKTDNVITFTGEDPRLNVFNVDAAEWSGSQMDIAIDGPVGATVVINVHGASVSLQNSAIRLAGVTKERILFNYVDALEIETSGVIHEGSVLAPYANGFFSGGSVQGSGFFGGSVTTEIGFEFHHFPFRGLVCEDAPAVPHLALTVTAGSAADGLVLEATNGASVIVTYQVANEGDTWLDDVTVVDEAAGAIGTLGYRLAPGAVAAFTLALNNVTTDTVVRATATGRPVHDDGSDWVGFLPLADSDSAAIHIAAAPGGGGGAGDDGWMRPDLGLSSVDFIHKPTLTGEVFSVRVTVENHGDLETDGGQLTVYLSEPTVVAAGKSGAASQAVGMLQPGESKVLEFMGLRAGSLSGTHHLRAFVDSLGEVAEYSDGDNQHAITYELNPIYMRIAMTPAGIELSWNSFWGQTYSLYRSTNLSGGFDLYQAHIEATPPTNTFIEAHPVGMSFYRLEVEQP